MAIEVHTSCLVDAVSRDEREDRTYTTHGQARARHFSKVVDYDEAGDQKHDADDDDDGIDDVFDDHDEAPLEETHKGDAAQSYDDNGKDGRECDQQDEAFCVITVLESANVAIGYEVDVNIEPEGRQDGQGNGQPFLPKSESGNEH